MIEFYDNPPEMTLTPQSLAHFIRNGYELKLYNKKAIKATAMQNRILIPMIPVCGKTLRKDYEFWTDDNWRGNAEEAGCLKFTVEVGSNLQCEFYATCGVLLTMPEVKAFILSFCDTDAFYEKSKEILFQFCHEGLADDFTRIRRNPLEISGRNIHVGAILRIIDMIEHETLIGARRAFLDLEDFSKEGIRQFCLKSGRCLNINRQSEE